MSQRLECSAQAFNRLFTAVSEGEARFIGGIIKDQEFSYPAAAKVLTQGVNAEPQILVVRFGRTGTEGTCLSASTFWDELIIQEGRVRQKILPWLPPTEEEVRRAVESTFITPVVPGKRRDKFNELAGIVLNLANTRLG